MAFRSSPALIALLVALGAGALTASALSGAANPDAAQIPYAAVFDPVAATATPAPTALPLPITPEDPALADTKYPFYMPMQGLRRPAVRLTIRCDASRAAGREVYAGRDADSLYGRAEGGFEFVFEALDAAGRPCVYPFAPWLPQIVGSLDGTQYIIRSSIPGRQVTFRSGDDWASIDLRLFDFGRQRVHFEMRDVALEFPRAIMPIGALHLEAFGGTPPGLFSAVIRRSRIVGGKNAIFVPAGQTMLYVENSVIAGNVGTNADQEHATYINGILVSHLRNASWYGQNAWEDQASGHQLKDKAYLRIYENLAVSNAPGFVTPTGTTPSAMPLIDASGYGFTWADHVRLNRQQPKQAAREGLVDLRTDMAYGGAGLYPWPLVAGAGWRMPAAPLGALDQVYLSVFQHTTVGSFRTEPFVFAQRLQGTTVVPGSNPPHIEGADGAPRSGQRMISLAFATTGRFARVYAPEGWTYVDPVLPPEAAWVRDRNAFIRHALGLIGR